MIAQNDDPSRKYLVGYVIKYGFPYFRFRYFRATAAIARAGMFATSAM
jgi:hypothetical protein